MKKGLAVLLVLVMSIGSLAAAFSSENGPSGYAPQSQMSTGPAKLPITPSTAPTDPMSDYLTSLDPTGPRFPTTPTPGEPLNAGEARSIIQSNMDVLLVYRNPKNQEEWIPLPSEAEYNADHSKAVTFANGTQVEIHGRIFERIIDPAVAGAINASSKDNLTLRVTFDGDLVPGGNILTGNVTTQIEPFIEDGNGTFQFILDINKDAGQYYIEVSFAGYPTTGTMSWLPLTYKAVVFVNHPAVVKVDVTPTVQVVGQAIQVSGSLTDDTGRLITTGPMKILFDNVLLGPTSDGVYIDDVSVGGAAFTDDFESEELGDWTTSTAPGRGVGNQWERGSPGAGVGPRSPHSGSRLWGTLLNSNYQRGAWSFLVTPRLNLTADHPYTLSFWAWWSVYWAEDYAYVMASMDGGLTWDEAGSYKFMGSLMSNDWELIEVNVTRYMGSDNVKFAFAFYSADKTLDIRPDATYGYQYIIPLSTEADKHRVSVTFPGDLLFRAGTTFKDITVKRIAHFEFEVNNTLKTGHRNNPVKLVAWLKDNQGEVLKTNVRGIPYIYQVAIYWDKTWNYAGDDPGEPAGPPRQMNRDSGEVSINYVVAPDQELGPANVTFRFGGADYYTAIEMKDVYYVKADVYVKLPSKELLRGYRGITLNIHGELRVVADQSKEDQQLGDAVSGEFISIYWGSDVIGNRRTRFDGAFDVDYLIPSTHDLGDVLVTFSYKGQSLYEPVTTFANYTVVSETFITILNQNVYKGSWVWINGTVRDDKDAPVANMPIYIIWKRAPEIGRATSKSDGTFSLQYYIEFEDKVGNVSVIARFKGTKIYLANETTATYAVKVGTVLQRRDRVMAALRGDQAQFSCKLYEDWGGTKGIEVQREEVALLIDEILVNKKRTAFDGTITFTAPIDPKIFSYGEVTLVFDFNGTEFYDHSRNASKIVLRANSLVTFTEIRVQGAIYDPLVDNVEPNEEVYGRVLVQDDNFQPIPAGNISVYYKEEGLRARKRLVKTGMTDESGYFEFNWTFNLKTEGNKTFIAEYEGLIVDTFLKADDQIILGSSAEYNVTYEIPPIIKEPPPLWLIILSFAAVIAVVAGAIWGSFYYRRRRMLRRMQRVIRRAADRLVAGNVYAATIFRAYREMASTLRAYGQLRKDSETFREFENAVRSALPIDQDNLDDFLTVLEEARYSEHDIGEGEKERAIVALRGVQASIEKIMITDEDAAKIKAKMTTEGYEEIVEPEIIVNEGQAPAEGTGPEKPSG